MKKKNPVLTGRPCSKKENEIVEQDNWIDTFQDHQNDTVYSIRVKKNENPLYDAKLTAYKQQQHSNNNTIILTQPF